MNLSQYVQNADFFPNLSNCILSDSDRDMQDKSSFIWHVQHRFIWIQNWLKVNQLPHITSYPANGSVSGSGEPIILLMRP